MMKMMRTTPGFPRVAAALAAAVFLGIAFVGGSAAGQSRKPSKRVPSSLRPAVQTTGGLCLMIGSGDGTRIPVLCEGGKYLVHVLEGDPAAVQRAREVVRENGLPGLALVERFSGTELPYYGQMANKVVFEDSRKTKVSLKEAVRVLAPGGKLVVSEKRSSQSSLSRLGLRDVSLVDGYWVGEKKWPEQMDEWTHFRHGPGRNPVSTDTMVGVSESIRWVMGRARQGSMMISAQGRNIYVLGSSLLARDAFNGLPLWTAGGIDTKVPPVAVGDRVYAISRGGDLTALDAATGKAVKTYDRVVGTPKDFVCLEGLLVVTDGEKAVWVLEAGTGKKTWLYECRSPRNLVAGEGGVYLIRGNVRRGEEPVVVGLDLHTGEVKWERKGEGYEWARKSEQCAFSDGLLAYEVSSRSDSGSGNEVHVLLARTGGPLKDQEYTPGMTHKKQANAFILNRSVMVQDGRTFRSIVDLARSARSTRAGTGHCYTGVATPLFFIHGEMNFTDLKTGKYTTNRITKGACGGADGTPGYVPANGLVYSFPKRCVCFPMLEGYAAFASAPLLKRSRGKTLTRGDAKYRRARSPENVENTWPMYRHDAIRSGGSRTTIVGTPETVWTTNVATSGKGTATPTGKPGSNGGTASRTGPKTAITSEWSRNPYVTGPITAPVVASGLVVVAEPDRHRVVALDAQSGSSRWSFVANGRVDSPPTLHEGLCLFGTRSGSIYCLDALDGKMVWRMSVSPVDRRIVAYGQIESSWPVAGSILIFKGTAYATAGRHPLADGGVRVVAFNPRTGSVKWNNAAAETGITRGYNRQGLDYDYFDHLVQDGQEIAMSRWKFHPANGKVRLERMKGYFNAGASPVLVPLGFWSYGYPNNRARTLRSLLAYHGNALYGIHGGRLFRRDFGTGEKIKDTWYSENEAGKGKDRLDALAAKPRWSVPSPGNADAMTLAGDRLFLVSGGRLFIYSAADGRKIGERSAATPVRDGMAAAYQSLYLSTQDGRVIRMSGGSGSK